MDPEIMLQQAEAALQRGASPDEVDARVQEVSGGEYQSVDALRVAARPGSAGENLRTLGKSLGGAARDLVTHPLDYLRKNHSAAADETLAMYEGATLNWGDELLGAAGKAFGKEGVGEATRQRMKDMPKGRRVMGEIVGSLLFPVGGAGVGVKALRAGRPLMAPGRALLEAGLEGMAVGGAGGAAATAGAAEPGHRGAAAVGGGLFGTVAGGTLGLGAGLATQVPRAFRSAREVGQNLADAVRSGSGRGRVPTSLLREAEKEVQREARRGLIAPLEEAGVTPPAVTDAFVTGGGSKEVARTLQRQLRAVQAKNPNARQVLREIAEVQAGKRESVTTPISFSTADELARKMSAQATKAEKMGAAEESNALIAAHDLIDEQLRTMPGYEDFKGVWAETSANIRALKAGRKAAAPSRTADDVRAELKALPSDDAREAYLNSWANQLNARLERRMGTTGDVQNILRSGREFDKKLRKLFPDEASFAHFKRVADVEGASISLAKRAQVVAGALAFLVGGTSLYARVIPVPGQ